MNPKFLSILVVALICCFIFQGCDTYSSDHSEFTSRYFGQSPPDRRPEIFAQGIISSPNQEHSSLAFTPDGKEIMWSLWQLPHNRKKHPQKIQFMKFTAEKWSKPATVPFSGKYMDGGPAYSADGNRVYFYSNRAIDNTSEVPNDIDLWYVERKNNSWSAPVNMGEPVNTDDVEASPCLSSNGNLYFVSNRNKYEDPTGNNDIFVSRLNNGVYGEPENLGNNINTDYAREGFPFIAPDDSYIIFSRDNRKFNSSGKQISGIRMLMISFRHNNKDWLPAAEMGSDFHNARFPSVSSDGKYLFYTKYTDKSNEDFYWTNSKIIDKLKSEFLK